MKKKTELVQRTDLMRALWEKSERSLDERERRLLEIAGNLVEATFTTDPLDDAILKAIVNE